MRRPVLLIATLACLAAFPLASVAQEAETPRRLTVQGSGEAAAAPDLAEITLGVTERAASAAEAMEAVSGVAGRILSRLEGLGVEARDVQTSDLSLHPVHGEGAPGATPEVTGYEASNRVTVRVRKLDELGAVLAAVLEDGANSLGGLRFSVADPDPLLDEARRAAVADARAKAELYAEAAGVTLGPLLSIDERGAVGGPPMPMAEMRMSAVPVAAGETGYGAEVQMVWELRD